jgi:serine/threonine protein kinase
MADNRPIDLDIDGLQDPVEIGVGGFATVFKAYQPAFRRTVAVKVLATLNLDDAARERFERVCQAMGSLSEHPNIVTVYGAGFTNSGRPYLVMAYLPGGSFQDRIDREGGVPWQDATLAGVHLAGALETAHRAQIVHRDIKPGNVLVSTYGDAQLTDFGIARISGGHETRSGVITASMAHAPPEVLDGQRPTIAADVYSLGSTIYELISGTPAFSSEEDESMVPMLRRILTDPPPDLRVRGVPDEVCQVIERAMAKKPEQRQASAVQFGREMQAARRANGLDAGKLTVPADVSVDVEPGQEITFVAASFTSQLDPATSAPVSPAASALTGPVPASSEYAPAGYTPAAPYQAPEYAQAAPQPTYTQTQEVPPSPTPAYVNTGPVPYTQTGPVPKKSSKGLLVGLGVIVALLLLGGGGFYVATSGKSTPTTLPATTAAGVTTTPSGVTPSSSTESSTTTEESTTTTEVATYTPELELNFVEECVRGAPAESTITTTTPPNRRLFCRCVFKEIKEKIPYTQFLEITDEVNNGKSILTTPIGPLIQDCGAKNPGAA